jgi:hypothetical protein
MKALGPEGWWVAMVSVRMETTLRIGISSRPWKRSAVAAVKA